MNLAKKLRITEGAKVRLIEEPDFFVSILANLPDGATLSTSEDGAFDVTIAFYREREKLLGQYADLITAMGENGILWVCYPKGASKLETDLNRDILRELLESKNLKAVSLVSKDSDWSAMRFKPAA